MCLPVYVCVHVHVGVYACLCLCMYICFPMCVAARGQLQKPFLAHCPLLETGSLRPRAHRVCEAGCLASKCPSIPASAALGMQAHTTPSFSCGFWGRASGPHSYKSNLCWPSHHRSLPFVTLYIYLQYSPILKDRRLGSPLAIWGRVWFCL